MKKNESNFKKALNELLGSGSDEASKTQREPETDYRQTDTEAAQAKESQENQTSNEYDTDNQTADEYDRTEDTADDYNRAENTADDYDTAEDASDEYDRSEDAADQYNRAEDTTDEHDTAEPVTDEPASGDQLPQETLPVSEPPVVSGGNSDISPSHPAVPEKPVYEAVITPDVIINGNIIAGSNLKILGKVFGNVDCEGTIVLSGSIEGDVSAEKLRFMTGGIQGNVSVKRDITAEKGTRVKGDVNAQSAVLSGDMQGELIVRENLELRESSSVFGNIKARGIAIYNGSRIKGMLDIGGEVEEMRTENES